MRRFSKKLLIASFIACSVVQPVRPMTPVVEGAIWNVCSLAVGFLCIKLGEWRGFIGRIEGKIDAVDRKTEENGRLINRVAVQLKKLISETSDNLGNTLNTKTDELGGLIERTESNLRCTIEEKTGEINTKIETLSSLTTEQKELIEERLSGIDKNIQSEEEHIATGFRFTSAHLRDIELNLINQKNSIETLSTNISRQSDFAHQSSKDCKALIEIFGVQVEALKNTVASHEQVAEIKKDVEAHHAEIEKWFHEMQGSRIACESKLDLMNDSLDKVALALEWLIPASETAASSALALKQSLAMLAVRTRDSSDSPQWLIPASETAANTGSLALKQSVTTLSSGSLR